MKIETLGTGSILTDRLSACSVVDDTLIVDTPNGSMKSARRSGYSPGRFSAALITHFHADHFFDCVFLLLELGLRQTRDQPFLMIGPEGLEERVRSLFELAYPESLERVMRNSRVQFVEVGINGSRFQTEDFLVEALEVSHTTERALGYLVTRGGITAGFTGDTEYCAAIDRICEESAIAVVDTSFLLPRSGHMGVSDVSRLAERYPGCRIVATHTTDEVFALDDVAFEIAHDGQVFVVEPGAGRG